MGKKTVLFKATQPQETAMPQEEGLFPTDPFADEETDVVMEGSERISEQIVNWTIDAAKKFLINPILKALNIFEGWDRINTKYNKGDVACDRFGKKGKLNIEIPGLFNWNLCLSSEAADQFIKDPVRGAGHGVMCYVDTSVMEPLSAIGKTISEAGDLKKLFNNLTELVFTPELPFFPNPFRIYDCLHAKLAEDREKGL